ncbi:MAG: hypothetical protein F6K21_07105 [Symploca sp. SIO2D2]|nr:hypothetical protein [Symploca sp. SIO2D2]
MFFNVLLNRIWRGVVAFAIATILLLTNSLLYPSAVFAEPNEPVEFEGQRLMPIPDGVALSWDIDCFWGEPIAYGGKTFRKMGYANGQMINFMDIEASYWPARFRLEPGEKLTIEGDFPHSRYASFNAYGGGAPTASLFDANIEPDPGSSNPFKQGAQRDTADDQRHYTIYVVNEPEPEDPAELAPNTLYARPAAAPYDIVELRYRTYLVDQTLQEAFDQRGGVPLPVPTVLTLADGQEVPGSTLCNPDRAMAQKMFFRAIPPNSFYSEEGEEVVEGVASWWQSYPCSEAEAGEFCNDPFTAPAQNPPVTEKFFGIPYSLKGLHLPPDERETLKPGPSCEPAPGFEGSADNAYLITFLNNHFGKVVQLRGHYPVTPRTYFDATTWDESNAQLRYWSVMSGNEIPSTQIAAGIVDEQIPINEDGYFSIVVSKPENRPKTATQACGHAWLDWGRRGDFTGRDGQTILAWRHTLELNGFTQSANSVCEAGKEQEVMGDYLPIGQYFEDAAEFDAAVGCLATE